MSVRAGCVCVCVRVCRVYVRGAGDRQRGGGDVVCWKMFKKTNPLQTPSPVWVSQCRQGEGCSGWGRCDCRPPTRRPRRSCTAGRGSGRCGRGAGGPRRNGRSRGAGRRGPHRSAPGRARAGSAGSRVPMLAASRVCACRPFLRRGTDLKSNTPELSRQGRPPARPCGRTRAPPAAAADRAGLPSPGPLPQPPSQQLGAAAPLPQLWTPRL